MTQFPVPTSHEQSIYAALELSKNSWLLAIQAPDRDNPSLHPIKGGDVDGLMAKLDAARDGVARGPGGERIEAPAAWPALHTVGRWAVGVAGRRVHGAADRVREHGESEAQSERQPVTSISYAMFAHAISSTRNTTPSNT